MKRSYKEILGFLLLIFLMSCTAYSQQYSFKVLAFSGKVDFQSSTAQSWERVQTGESFKKDYKIRLGKNSYSALVYKDGRTLEMMNEGIFNINELEKNILVSKISVTQKFANFVATEIMIDKSNGKTMNELAAVVRAKPFHIESAIPSITSFQDPLIDFSWYSYPPVQKYVFCILNSGDSPIFMDLAGDTTYKVNTEKLKLNRETKYKWYVFDADNPKIVSDTNSIMVLSDHHKQLILDTLQLFKNEIESIETPLNILSVGAFYERNNLNVEALNQYNKVMSLAPESEEYKKLFARFLLRYKLYTRAAELLSEE